MLARALVCLDGEVGEAQRQRDAARLFFASQWLARVIDYGRAWEIGSTYEASGDAHGRYSLCWLCVDKAFGSRREDLASGSLKVNWR